MPSDTTEQLVALTIDEVALLFAHCGLEPPPPANTVYRELAEPQNASRVNAILTSLIAKGVARCDAEGDYELNDELAEWLTHYANARETLILAYADERLAVFRLGESAVAVTPHDSSLVLCQWSDANSGDIEARLLAPTTIIDVAEEPDLQADYDLAQIDAMTAAGATNEGPLSVPAEGGLASGLLDRFAHDPDSVTAALSSFVGAGDQVSESLSQIIATANGAWILRMVAEADDSQSAALTWRPRGTIMGFLRHAHEHVGSTQ